MQAGLGIVMLRSTVNGNKIAAGGGRRGCLARDRQRRADRDREQHDHRQHGRIGRGGGIFISFGASTTPSIVNATIAGNSATSAGGIYAEHRSSSATTVSLVNTIVGESGRRLRGRPGPFSRVTISRKTRRARSRRPATSAASIRSSARSRFPFPA